MTKGLVVAEVAVHNPTCGVKLAGVFVPAASHVIMMPWKQPELDRRSFVQAACVQPRDTLDPHLRPAGNVVVDLGMCCDVTSSPPNALLGPP